MSSFVNAGFATHRIGGRLLVLDDGLESGQRTVRRGSANETWRHTIGHRMDDFGLGER